MARLNTCQVKLFFFFFFHPLLTFVVRGDAATPQLTGFSLDLIPWDSPKSTFHLPNLTQTQKIQMMAFSSIARSTTNVTLNANALQIPVKNHDLQFSVKFKIGNPGTDVNLLLDTGSGPIWTKCQQSRSPYFNPLMSKTYKALPCNHPMCHRDSKLCDCVKDQCVCSLKYGVNDGKINQVNAVLSSDSFTLPEKKNSLKTFTNMIFGCSSKSPVFFGILGMNKLPVSLISQVKNQVQGRYSYCLYGGDGYLRFGKAIPPMRKEAKTTRILYPDSPTMFLDLRDISVAGKRLGISPALFSYKEGGFIIDTGAQFTVLKKKAYDKVIKALSDYYSGKLKRVNGKKYGLDLCYKSNPSLKTYASMTFHLQGADYVTNNLYFVPETGIGCIGMVPGDRTIMGAMQQWNKRFIFDINMNTVQFIDEDCSRDRG